MGHGHTTRSAEATPFKDRMPEGHRKLASEADNGVGFRYGSSHVMVNTLHVHVTMVEGGGKSVISRVLFVCICIIRMLRVFAYVYVCLCVF